MLLAKINFCEISQRQQIMHRGQWPMSTDTRLCLSSHTCSDNKISTNNWSQAEQSKRCPTQHCRVLPPGEFSDMKLLIYSNSLIMTTITGTVALTTSSDPVSTRMGDRLWTGKPFRYVTSQLGQLSLSSLRCR